MTGESFIRARVVIFCRMTGRLTIRHCFVQSRWRFGEAMSLE